MRQCLEVEEMTDDERFQKKNKKRERREKERIKNGWKKKKNVYMSYSNFFDFC